MTLVARFVGVAIAVWSFLLVACGGDAVDPTAVPECQLYEAKIASCLHRFSAGFATQASLIPKTKADRERIREQCSENLARLEKACR